MEYFATEIFRNNNTASFSGFICNKTVELLHVCQCLSLINGD